MWGNGTAEIDLHSTMRASHIRTTRFMEGQTKAQTHYLFLQVRRTAKDDQGGQGLGGMLLRMHLLF